MRITALIILVTVAVVPLPAADLSSLSLSGTPVTDGNDITFSTTGTAKLRITVCYPDVMRFWVDSGGGFLKSPSYVVDRELWALVTKTITDQGAYFQILTSELSVRVYKSPIKIAIYKSDDAALIAEERGTGGVGWNSGMPHSFWNLTPEERVFGLGEDNKNTTGALDRRGTIRTIWTNANPFCGHTSSNISIPFFMSTGRSAGGGYGFFFDNTYSATFDMGRTSLQYFSWSSRGGELLFYFFYGPSFKKILERYTSISGRPPLPPVWAFGYFQSRCMYTGWAQVDSVIDCMRANNLPLETVILDWLWVDCNSNFQWSSRFAGADAKIAAYRSQGIRFMLIVDPQIESGCSNYADALANNMFATCGSGTCPSGWCRGALYDPTVPNFTSWLWSQNQAKHLFEQGIAGWWLDLTEPDGEPDTAVYHDGPSAKIHNIFSNKFSEAFYSGQLQLSPNLRPYILTRTGFSGIQKYGVSVWSGDVCSDYQSMMTHVPESQNSSLSGIPYWSMDIGGFLKDPGDYFRNDKNGAHARLYQRWFQFGCFCPITRAHGAKECEPYCFTQAVTDGCRKYLRLRYRLLPYIYSYAWECSRTGVPIQRAVVLEYQDDPDAWRANLQYLFGKELLVAPVTQEDAVSRSVYFPAGTWFDYDSGISFTGPVTAAVSAPQDKLPIFVRSGAIIPMAQPGMIRLTDSTGARVPWDPITFDIYPDGASSFVMYQDDGITREFQTAGAFTLTSITSVFTPGRQEIVSISETNKLFAPSKYEFTIHLRNQTIVPSPILWNQQAVDSLTSPAAYANASTGRWWDAAGKVLWVKAAASPATNQQLLISLDGSPIGVGKSGNGNGYPPRYDVRVVQSGSGPAIRLAVPSSSLPLRIEMFDFKGRKIAELAQGLFQPGYHTIALGSNSTITLAAVWYLCRMSAGKFEKTIKIVIPK
ncbi:MAG: DUF4968 domain-containing protein [Chitinispirillaceae bacterium]|nr:DUF4968 domain-containing protein [Chitinispirillaceae bacterium]